jgi:hypothetical protein
VPISILPMLLLVMESESASGGGHLEVWVGESKIPAVELQPSRYNAEGHTANHVLQIIE